MSIIGDRLKVLRYKRKIKIPTIISELNIARSTYTGYELGRRNPDGKSLAKLADILDTSVDYIVGVT
ncbi:helix-turn-helix domain-containing protein, partial [Jeotgalibacillus marinus]